MAQLVTRWRLLVLMVVLLSVGCSQTEQVLPVEADPVSAPTGIASVPAASTPSLAAEATQKTVVLEDLGMT
jgi:hypothetical protein